MPPRQGPGLDVPTARLASPSCFATPSSWLSLPADVEPDGRGVRAELPQTPARQGQPMPGWPALPPVQTRWGGCILDFLELPPAGSDHDFLQVHTDLLTGSAWLAPTFKTATSVTGARNFVTSVFRDVGLPDVLVSDRDTRFVRGERYGTREKPQNCKSIASRVPYLSSRTCWCRTATRASPAPGGPTCTLRWAPRLSSGPRTTTTPRARLLGYVRLDV